MCSACMDDGKGVSPVCSACMDDGGRVEGCRLNVGG